ncbi:C40 family peptidase [Cohnella sp. AR92]|uniref:C40 family peptidase n=1 Tax=Cohnella sp. AR92 TaxID=648716 RepID=UPI000F8D0E59|nr:C40 family peptidase [Cohnella sp. AR92]RUS46656.1 NlpC/P60 family protein [Cohnella sp. AR92]
MVGLLTGIGWFGMAASHSSTTSAATAESLELLSFGKDYIGTPYVYGASGINGTSFDCSSYTQFVFRQLGISLPRTSVEQAYMGEPVSKAYLSVGDLVFFRTGGGWISHVAIYAGDGKILHAASSSGVTISNLNSTYWKNSYVTARRIL